jgi:hypothetical protein
MHQIREVLQNMLSNGRFIHVENNQVILYEREQNAILNTLCVDDLPPDTIVLKMDKTIVQNLLKTPGVGRRTDYILLFKTAEKKYIVHAELKSSRRNDDTEVMEKFKGTDCILDYCESIMGSFHGYQNGFSGFERRYVLCYKTPSISKLPSRPHVPHSNTRPEYYIPLPVTNYDKNDVTTKITFLRLLSI